MVDKWGTKVIDGARICKRCGLPLEPAGKSGPLVDESMVVTLPALPGFRIIRVLGLVTELSATSGWTATAKGNFALADATANLRRSASAMGANAVVGLSAAVFGARGGVTSMVGGDAVGVLLTGTAVVVDVAQPDD